MKYTLQELDCHAMADILNDATQAENQAKEGPYYPEKNITKETLLNYSKECRATYSKYAQGGLHDALLKVES
jgi:hypothetical protein